MDDEILLQYLLEDAAMQPEEDAIAKQMEKVKALRGGVVSTDPQMVSGRLVTNPMGHLVNAGAALAGGYLGNKAEKASGALAQRRDAGFRGLVDRMRAKKAPSFTGRVELNDDGAETY